MTRKRKNRNLPAPTVLRPFAIVPIPMNPPSVNSTLSSSSGVASQNSNDSSVVSSIENAVPYTIMRLKNMSSRFPLKEILHKVSPYATNIIGIARCADYNNQRLGLTIYLISTSAIDGVFLENTFIDYREDNRDPQSMTKVDLSFGRAKILNASYISSQERIPVTIMIKGLKRIKNSENQTDYLANLVSAFEAKGNITMIRLNYDSYGKRTKNTAFMTFLNQSHAKSMANEVTTTTYKLNEKTVTALLSDGVPFLVRPEDINLINGGVISWSPDTEKANLLIYSSTKVDVNEKSHESRNVNRHQSSKLERERASSTDSTICVLDLKGGTVPFPQADDVAQITSTESPQQSSSHAIQKAVIEVHDIISLPQNAITEVTMSDGEILVLTEFVNLEDNI